MDTQEQLKLQAYVDGELPESETRQVAEWLARDPEAKALHGELLRTRQVLSGFEAEIRLPETREFYWSKIQREIQRQEQPRPEPVAAPSWLAVWRRLLVPSSGLALLALAGLLMIPWSPVHFAETSLEDSQAFTYHDYTAGMTLVWLSYPAKQEIADEDEFGILE
jgi:anti-sigma factor RsiW